MMKKILCIILSLILLLSMTGCGQRNEVVSYKFHMQNASTSGLKFNPVAAKNGETAKNTEKFNTETLEKKRTFVFDGKEYETDLYHVTDGWHISVSGTLHTAEYRNDAFSVLLDAQTGDMLSVEIKEYKHEIYVKAVDVSSRDTLEQSAKKFFADQFGLNIKYDTVNYSSTGYYHKISFGYKNEEGLWCNKPAYLVADGEGNVSYIGFPHTDEKIKKRLLETKIDFEKLNEELDVFCASLPIEEAYSYLTYSHTDTITSNDAVIEIDMNGNLLLSATVVAYFDSKNEDDNCDLQYFFMEAELGFEE